MKGAVKQVKEFTEDLPEKIKGQTIPDKIKDGLGSTRWDALVVLGVENVQYCSGAYLAYARGYLDRPNIVVWPRKGEPTYITGAEMIGGVKPQAKHIQDFVGYEEKGALPPAVIVDTVADVLRSKGCEDGLIGLEMLRTSVLFWNRLSELLPEARFEPADDMLRRLRMVKTAEEIEIMATAATLTDDGIWKAFAGSKPGDTELEVSRRIRTSILDNGVSAVTVIYLGSGEGARVVGSPSTRQLEPGTFVRLDINTVYGGYYCDMGRMAFVGEPSAEQIKSYQDMNELKWRIVDFMRPGRTCAEIHAFYLAEAERMNLQLFTYPYIGIGHTTGVNNDEFPKLNVGHDTVLEPGMIFDVEPDTIGPDGEVMHSEDMVLITDRGYEVLTQSEGHDWSDLFVIPV